MSLATDFLARGARGVMLMLGASFAVPARADGVPSASPHTRVEPLDIPAFMRIPRPLPDVVSAYADAPTQQGDLFLPAGRGPFPVVALIHGGCWSSRTAGREQLRHLGADLAARGIAVWSIGYRRADEGGGGYPGTFLDIGMAMDHLRTLAQTHPLDLTRLVAVGHSAGGHLALWASGRDRLPPASPLFVRAPVVPRRVVALAGIGDLETFAPLIPGICGEDIGANLLGSTDDTRTDLYADTSPVRLGADGVQVVMVSGSLDRLVPPYVAHDYERAVTGDVRVKRIDIAGAGHFDLVADGAAWRLARAQIQAMLAR